MARRKGSLKLGSNIEPQTDAPLDARQTVPTIADLTAEDTFPYCYIGMMVAVQATGQVFILTGDPDEPVPTDAANWKELGSGSGSGGAVTLNAGPGIKIESALNAQGELEYTIALDLSLESESENLTITKKGTP